MTEEVKTENQATEESTHASTPEPTSLTSNADVKEHPLFKKMTAQLAQFQQAEKDRASRDAQAQKEAEIKALEAKGEYEAALTQQKSEMERLVAQHEREILHRDLQSELFKQGFNNDLFVKGAITGYDAETHGDINAYVEALANDEANKGFLSTGTGRQVHDAAGLGRPAASGSMPLTGKRLLEYKNSPDPEKRAQYRKVAGEYFDKHGTLDGLYN